MDSTLSALTGLALALSLTASAQAAIVTFTPDSNPAVAGTPAFGLLTDPLVDNYIDFGVDFTFGGVEGWFNDVPTPAFGGVNDMGVLDLFTPVDGRIVQQGALLQGYTRYFYAEAGVAVPGLLTLEVFDIDGNLLGSMFNNFPPGAHGRTTFAIQVAGIASFRISGIDTFGVNEIRLATPTAVAIPEPTAWALMILGFGAAGIGLRTRRAAARA